MAGEDENDSFLNDSFLMISLGSALGLLVLVCILAGLVRCCRRGRLPDEIAVLNGEASSSAAAASSAASSAEGSRGMSRGGGLKSEFL